MSLAAGVHLAEGQLVNIEQSKSLIFRMGTKGPIVSKREEKNFYPIYILDT